MQILRIARPENALQAGIFACLLLLPGTRLLGEDESSQWLLEHQKIVENAKVARDENSIKELADIVESLDGKISKLTPEMRVFYDESRRTLISIPGHADYFGNRIKAMTDGDITGDGTTLSGRRGWDFEALAQLQSQETVRVLGDLLFDERNPFKDEETDSPWVPACTYAVKSLHALGIKNPPVSTLYPDYENDLHTWQLWYQQVRAGTRTFSFKGNDRVYTLAGPVTEAPETGQSPVRPATPTVLPATASAPQGPKAPFIAAVLVAVGAGLAVFWRAKHRRA